MLHRVEWFTRDGSMDVQECTSIDPSWETATLSKENIDDAPINWEKPFGTPEVHVALSFFSGDRAALQPLLELAQSSQDDLAGVSIIYRVDIAMLPTTRTHFGYKDGIGIPLIEGSGSAGYP